MEKKFNWGGLSKQQLGTYCEYFVKMECTMFGFQVYAPEVDDRGIDFVCRHGSNSFISVQVKSVRTMGNVGLLKSKFCLADDLYLALGLMLDGKLPKLYLIPTMAWKTPGPLLGHNDYGEGYTSKPEWRVNLSARNMPLLEPYRFETTATQLALLG